MSAPEERLRPQDPSAFRTEVLRRAVRLERRRRRLRTLSVAAILCTLLLSATAVQVARTGAGREVAVGAGGRSGARDVVRATIVELPDVRTPWAAAGGGRLFWILDRGGDRGPVVRRFEGGRQVAVTQLPADAAPEQLVSGTDGGIWMTDPARARAFHVLPDGGLVELPTGGTPSASATFAAERLWFADRRGGRLTGLSGDGSAEHRQLPAGAAPDVVAVGPEGSLWFGDAERATAGSVSPSGAVAMWTLASEEERVVTMGIGPGQALWLLIRSDHGLRLGRADVGGRIVEEDVDTSSAARGLAVGPDGSLWFTSGDGSRLHRRSYTASSAVPLERPVKARSWALAADGTMWAVDADRGELVEVTLPPP